MPVMGCVEVNEHAEDERWLPWWASESRRNTRGDRRLPTGLVQPRLLDQIHHSNVETWIGAIVKTCGSRSLGSFVWGVRRVVRRACRPRIRRRRGRAHQVRGVHGAPPMLAASMS
jgi:hypothetical protein